MMEWPDWWDWELEISSHCRKRMRERDFSEIDLRAMLEDATSVLEQEHGTFIVETVYEDTPWEVIVCPDEERQLVVVVTGYKNV